MVWFSSRILSQFFSYWKMRLSGSMYGQKYPTDEIWKTDAVGSHSTGCDSVGLCTGVYTSPFQIHPPPTHPRFVPQPPRQTLVDHLSGLLSLPLRLKGAREVVGQWEESEVRELVSGTPSPQHGSRRAALASCNCSLPSPHQAPTLNSQGYWTRPVVSQEPAHTAAKGPFY